MGNRRISEPKKAYENNNSGLTKSLRKQHSGFLPQKNSGGGTGEGGDPRRGLVNGATNINTYFIQTLHRLLTSVHSYYGAIQAILRLKYSCESDADTLCPGIFTDAFRLGKPPTRKLQTKRGRPPQGTLKRRILYLSVEGSTHLLRRVFSKLKTKTNSKRPSRISSSRPRKRQGYRTTPQWTQGYWNHRRSRMRRWTRINWRDP